MLAWLELHDLIISGLIWNQEVNTIICSFFVNIVALLQGHNTNNLFVKLCILHAKLLSKVFIHNSRTSIIPPDGNINIHN